MPRFFFDRRAHPPDGHRLQKGTPVVVALLRAGGVGTLHLVGLPPSAETRSRCRVWKRDSIRLRLLTSKAGSWAARTSADCEPGIGRRTHKSSQDGCDRSPRSKGPNPIGNVSRVWPRASCVGSTLGPEQWKPGRGRRRQVRLCTCPPLGAQAVRLSMSVLGRQDGRALLIHSGAKRRGRTRKGPAACR